MITKIIDYYNKPKCNDMIIIIPYFNYCNSINIRNNIMHLKQLLDDSETPYYIAEILFGNQISCFDKQDNIITYKTNSYMFYKENIINMVEEIIPIEYTKLCILDGDIVFDNHSWYSILSLKLNNYDICQPFDTAFWLNKYKKVFNKNRSIIVQNIGGHTGFAWGYRRDWFRKYKLFELSVIGGGDNLMSSAILNIKAKEKKWVNKSYSKYLLSFETKPTISYCSDINVHHLYHGLLKNRQYNTRHGIVIDLLNKFNCDDVSKLIIKRNDGLLEWKDEYINDCNTALFEYFKNRNDDE